MATAEKPPDDVTGQPMELPEDASDASPDVIRIGLGAWLRSMCSIAYGIFRHPLSTTYVDLSSGESVQLPS